MPDMTLALDIGSAVLLYGAFLVNAYILALYYVHMLQLNSYMPLRYFRWLAGSRSAVFQKQGWLAVATLAAGFSPLSISGWPIRLACATIFILHTILNRPHKAKKPLVFTARVKRLFVTYSVLILLLCALLWLADFRRIGLSLLFLWGTLSPVTILFAHYINAPLERLIARRYVNDAKSILARMDNLIVIGITGSYGKTSTKSILRDLLSVKYNVLMTPESYNTTMGVVRTIRESLLPSHEVFIVEMGAKNRGDIHEICELVRPRYGILTSIGEQHLETFGSLETIIDTKFELADAIPADGLMFLNGDNEWIAGRRHPAPSLRYSIDEGSAADYKTSDITVSVDGSHFTVTAPDGASRRFSTKLLGGHILQNITGCVAVAHALGIPMDDLLMPVRHLKPVPHRLQLLPNGYIDDAYNSNPAGFRAALDVLSGFDGQRVLVTPGMVELGERQEELNREAGRYAAGKCDWAVLVGVKQAPPLKAGLLEGGFDENRIHTAATLTDALAFVNSLPSGEPRTVLLENDLPDNF